MPTPGVSTGLVYHWLLNGDATDETGTHDLTEYGGITYAADVPSVLSGVATQSVDLDGAADYLATTINVTFKSVSCWFQTDSFATQQRVYDWSTFNGCSPILRTSGVVEYVYRDAGDAVSFVAAKTGLSAATWHHIVWSGDSVNNSLYYNGTLHSSTTDGFRTTAGLFIAGQYYGLGNYLNGKLCDLRLYSIPLTASDVTTIYNGDWGGGSSNGAAAYYYRHLLGA